jgi:glyoxylase-like metal-dependent hydrolase (beta-lactamase superfamily II)
LTTHPLDRPALRKGRVSRLTPNVSLIQGTTWQCNCIVVRKGKNALAGDGFWNPMDVDTLAEMVEGYNTHLLITHGDIDHCTCIGRCTSARAVGAPATAARVRSGSAGHDLKLESAKWGLTFAGEPRIDLEVRPPECVRLGEWTVRTFEAAGHAGDGTAYLIEEEGIFLVGDYLMASQHPIVWWSLKEAYRTTERLLGAIRKFDFEWVVPGHGPVLTRADAEIIAQQDLTYLAEVDRAADEAQRLNYTKREWHLAVESVAVPRPCAPDVEMLCPRLLNAAATFRDRGVDANLPWIMDMA